MNQDFKNIDPKQILHKMRTKLFLVSTYLEISKKYEKSPDEEECYRLACSGYQKVRNMVDEIDRYFES